MTGGLFDPLGMNRGDDRSPSRPSVPMVAAGCAAALLATLVAVAYFRDDGDRGRPIAVTPIVHVQASPGPVAPQPPATAATSAAIQPPLRDDQDVEIQNGVRVIRPHRDSQAHGGQTLHVPDSAAAR